GQSTGLEHLDDQLDLVLHCFDVMEALDLQRPYVLGESMGGWMAAEMAALRPRDIGRLALAAPIGLWRDEAPVADMFGMMPHELVPHLFHDQSCPAAQGLHAVTTLFSEKADRTQHHVELLLTLVRGVHPAPEARATEARMTSAGLVQTNGFAAYLLCAAMKRRSSLRRSLTLVNEPRRTARRSSWANHPSTALSQEALVGVKCSVKRGWAA